MSLGDRRKRASPDHAWLEVAWGGRTDSAKGTKKGSRHPVSVAARVGRKRVPSKLKLKTHQAYRRAAWLALWIWRAEEPSGRHSKKRRRLGERAFARGHADNSLVLSCEADGRGAGQPSAHPAPDGTNALFERCGILGSSLSEQARREAQSGHGEERVERRRLGVWACLVLGPKPLPCNIAVLLKPRQHDMHVSRGRCCGGGVVSIQCCSGACIRWAGRRTATTTRRRQDAAMTWPWAAGAHGRGQAQGWSTLETGIRHRRRTGELQHFRASYRELGQRRTDWAPGNMLEAGLVLAPPGRSWAGEGGRWGVCCCASGDAVAPPPPSAPAEPAERRGSWTRSRRHSVALGGTGPGPN